ncbi:MAG: glycosyltransferase family 39 protein, partial [Burkholderiaceae bacterium]|nr:glycosyltransferase family 39 protein [Burkholderiaceae bacterium]
GYGRQPPLYTWLQWGINQWLGPSVLALSVLKHALIALSCALMWLAARELLGRRAAWWAAASLFLLPSFGWYAISDLTHTVLVTAMTCGAWWLLLRIVRREGRGCQLEFAALGLVCGCGMLAKYSFALVLAALIVALLSVRGPRRALFGRGWWWALLIGLIVVAPHGRWLLAHGHAAAAGTIREMGIAPQHGWGAGLGSLLMAGASTLALWAILALAAFGSGWWRRPDAAPGVAGQPAAWLRPVFGRYLALIAGALLLMVFAAGVTVFKDRWMLPLLAPVPLVAFALRPELDVDARGKRFTGVTLALILAVVVAAAAQPWFAAIDGKAHPFNTPAVHLAQALRGAGYDGQSRIIAADALLAGTLLTRFPAAQADACYRKADDAADYVTRCVADSVQMAEQAGRGWLIVSSADRVKPGWWDQALARIPGSDNLPRGNLRMPLRMAGRNHRLASYDFVWHPAPMPKP